MADKDLLLQLRLQMQQIENDSAQKPARKAKTAVQKQAQSNMCEKQALQSFDEQGLPSQLNEEAAFKRIVRWCNVSERSQAQITERLKREGFSDGVIEPALKRACDYGIVNDARFAEMLVRSRIAQGKGSVGIQRELAKNGIDAHTLDGWPEAYFSEANDEVNRALAFLDKHPTRAKNVRDGAYRKLIGKGYSSSVASTAARIYSEQVQ